MIQLTFEGTNRNAFFPPIGKAVRSTFDVSKIPDTHGSNIALNWPIPIAGQTLRLDVKERIGHLHECLRDPEHQAEKDLVTKRGYDLPGDETYANVHVATWLFHMKRLVDAGEATVTEGTMPDKIGRPLDCFITTEKSPTEKSMDRLAMAIDRQSEVFEAVLEKLGKK